MYKVASTPLIEASTWGYDDIVKLLLKAGAYKDASKDVSSRLVPPLFLASHSYSFQP